MVIEDSNFAIILNVEVLNLEKFYLFKSSDRKLHN